MIYNHSRDANFSPLVLPSQKTGSRSQNMLDVSRSLQNVPTEHHDHTTLECFLQAHVSQKTDGAVELALKKKKRARLFLQLKMQIIFCASLKNKKQKTKNF